jgi:formiminotetrahydrofolate cyclodeaminase
MTVARLLDALASSDPTPGGGTASAIAGAMGTSLLIMVSGLTKSKSNTDEEKTALAAVRHALEPLRGELMRLADADADAFDQVMAAYRLPKAGDEEKAVRTAAIQRALHQATVVPLETLRACAAAMPHATQVADCGNRSAASDVGVGIGLLEAAAAGAAANVRINLDGLTAEGFKSAASSETSRLAADTASRARAARQKLAAAG